MCKSFSIPKIILFAAFLSLSATLAIPSVRAAEGPLPPVSLRCEYLKNPAGIDVRQPRFSWVLGHTQRAQMQTAYQVLVASSLELLSQDKGDRWDSGKTASDDSTQVVYSGKPLESDHSYRWKVRYWDKDGNASDYSQSARFDVALLSPSEWKGKWIGGANMLRKEVTLSGKVVRARAYVTALGYYEFRINGEKIGCNELDPAWTTYPVRVLYSTYDITAHLRAGKNAFGAMIGGGWALLGGGDVPAPYKQPALLVQVNIDFADGKAVQVASDNSWKVTEGPIVSDSVWNGEVYDARREQPGWDSPGFDDSAWTAAEILEGSKGILSAQMMPPIRDVDSMVPVALSNPRPGVYVYDMGQNFSGWVDLHVSGPRGAQVQLRFSELLYDTGMINRENIRGAKSRDIYILRGDGEESYHPHFTYHGFRYVEVTGFSGTPSLDSLRGHVVHSAVETTGSFVTSKPLLNQIHKIIRWSDLTNLA
ncbi:MAG: family 78 glycoside hydrolase catalytic domain, partial [Terriglobia bacterium]